MGGQGLAIAGIVTGGLGTVMPVVPGILIALLLPALSSVRESARRSLSSANMKQSSLGAMMYQEEHGRLPMAADDTEGPPVSWRVALAPYLEDPTAMAYDRGQPWDGPANRGLAERTPQIFANPNLPTPGITNYLVLVGDQTAFPPDEPATRLEAPSMTILFVEADEDRAVAWSEPRDLDYNPDDPHRGLGNFRPGVFLAGFGDASVQTLSSDIDADLLRALISRTAQDNRAAESHFFDIK